MDHVWRVFENGKEFLFKNLDITVTIKSEKDANGQDYNITCQGYMTIDRDTSTAVITAKVKKKIPEPITSWVELTDTAPV
jgi:hypothetical protein